MLKRMINKRHIIWLVTLFFTVIVLSTAFAGTQATYYVSPNGSDSNPGTQSAPFQTITKARDVVRTINGSMSGDIYVYLRGGTYTITSTITFGPQDSGTNRYSIYYEAYPGEVPVLNGGTLVTGWTQYSGNIYRATLNRTTKLRTLIVNDRRVYMANKTVNCQGSWGTYNISAGQANWAWISGSKADGARYNTGDVPVLGNAGDVEIINSTTWNQNIVCVREITTEGTSRILKFQQPYGAIALNQGWNAGFATSGSHKIQNAYEFLDSSGEFYFNRATSTLYYYKGSEDMSTAIVYAPNMRTLLDISGSSKTNRVRNITFKGITFANTEAELVQVAGSYGKTTAQSATWCKAFADPNYHKDKYRAYEVMLGGIVVNSADSINFTGNTIKHIGNEGISLINDVCNSTILGNSITDIGGSGIQVGHPQHVYEGDGGTNEKYPPSVEGVCRNNTIKNNYIYSTTNIYLAHQGISAYFVDNLTIEHNHIEGTNYGGVSLGWGWCEFDEVAFPSNPTTTCRNNKFNNNRVYDCMKTLNDSGAFYTVGAQPNSEANNNYVKASTTHFQGVYHPDEGTAWYTGNNLVFDIVPGQDNFELNEWKRKHDNHYDNIYSTSSAYTIGAPNCTVTNLHVYPNANWPPEALDIINNAGLEPAYQYLLQGNAPPPPPPVNSGAQIEAENYSSQSGIQTETCTEGGLNVAYIENGDYIAFNNFTFESGVTGFEGRVASATSGGSIEIRLDSITGTLAGTCPVSGTGGWQTWTTKTCKISGASGTHTLYLKFTGGSGFLFNLNWFKFTGSGGDDEDVPTEPDEGLQIEAESYNSQSGIQTESCTEGGLNVAYIENGDYIAFNNFTFESGVTGFEGRVASATSGGSIEIRLDSITGTLAGTCPVSGTGGWQTWTTKTCKVSGASGTHTLYLKFTGGSGFLFNLNWFKFTESGEDTGRDSYYIKNVATNLYIDGNGRTTNGENVFQWSYSGNNNQKWVLEPFGSNFLIKNVATNLYLDGMGRTTNGSICSQWSYSASAAQQWVREASGSNFRFRNVATGLYLDGMGNSSNGSNVCQWSNSGSSNQQWIIE